MSQADRYTKAATNGKYISSSHLRLRHQDLFLHHTCCFHGKSKFKRHVDIMFPYRGIRLFFSPLYYNVKH